MMTGDDIKFMKRCLELAFKAEGATYPNPMVGSVIVNSGRIIGEGYHLKAGGPHAEVAAVMSVKDKGLLRSSTLYVNLEPCAHFGRTPPCADMIIAEGIPRVFIGSVDTSDKVSGRGIERLRNAGCEVVTGIMEDECRRLNRRFFTFNEKKRPYITLKWAESSDGFIDKAREEGCVGPTWISGKSERILVHRWRASEQAILAGAGTIRTDNPRLNVREWPGNDPLVIILSGSGDLDSGFEALKRPGVLLFTKNKNKGLQGAEQVIIDSDQPAAKLVCDYLFNRGIQSLFIEGGAMVLDHFISSGYWDEARIFRGKESFYAGVRAPAISGIRFSETEFGKSTLEILLRQRQ